MRRTDAIMAKTVILNKSFLEDGTEYLFPTTLIDESDMKSFEVYNIAKCICDVLNYFQENTPDAFGNAPYRALDGYMRGYLNGLKLDLIKEDNWWIVKKGKRTVMKIEVPKKTPTYYQELQDTAKTIRKVFGYE
jgi:hypothetical protein